MGVKNLMTIIEKYSPNSIKIKTFNDYHKKTLGIDCNLMIYKIVLGVRSSGYDLKNDGIIVTHIHGMIQKLLSFKKNNIKAIFVFDGIPSDLKMETLENRKKQWDLLKLKYKNAKSDDEKKKYYYHKSDITTLEIMEVIEIIKIFGYPIIESDIEADITLAELSKQNKIDYIVTDDLDILVFGGKNILKGFSISDKKKFQEISLKQFLKDSGLTQQKLIDIAILIGCDYCPKTKKIGPITAYKLVKENGNIEFPKNYNTVKKFFMSSDKNINNFKYKESNIDINKLVIFLKNYKFKQKYIDTLIGNITK